MGLSLAISIFLSYHSAFFYSAKLEPGKKPMEETTAKTSTVTSSSSSSSKLSSKRLLFDRRYGWVFDDWTDPAEEALAGGRGMFCILPLAKACLKKASVSINFATSSAAKYFERPDRFSLQLLQAGFCDQLHKLTSVIQKPEFNFSTGKETSSLDSSTSHLQMEIQNNK